jgi:hypothetical protein
MTIIRSRLAGLGDARLSRGGVEHLTRASMVTIWPVM